MAKKTHSDKPNTKLRPIALFLGGSVALGLTGLATVQAESNPFAAEKLSQGYQLASQSQNEGKCGSGECGGNEGDKDNDGKCGSGQCGSSHGDNPKPANNGKPSDGKCGAGKCGADKPEGKPKPDSNGKPQDGKCGAGKCGADKPDGKPKPDSNSKP